MQNLQFGIYIELEFHLIKGKKRFLYQQNVQYLLLTNVHVVKNSYFTISRGWKLIYLACKFIPQFPFMLNAE